MYSPLMTPYYATLEKGKRGPGFWGDPLSITNILWKYLKKLRLHFCPRPNYIPIVCAYIHQQMANCRFRSNYHLFSIYFFVFLQADSAEKLQV